MDVDEAMRRKPSGKNEILNIGYQTHEFWLLLPLLRLVYSDCKWVFSWKREREKQRETERVRQGETGIERKQKETEKRVS
jgi:hypothetical protein